jgi:hypothetical protein
LGAKISFSLGHLHSFVFKIHRELRRHPRKILVACVGRSNDNCLSEAAVLLGGFLILGQGLELEHVKASFRQVEHLFVRFSDIELNSDSNGTSVQDCWSALYRARLLGWLDFPSDETQSRSLHEDEAAVEVEEMLHYADPANGSIHTVVPGKILCFPKPADLPPGKRWMDFQAGGAAAVRRFSAAFYADLFAELDVSVAVCLHTSDYDRAAFAEQGIEVEDLGLDPRSPHLLRAMDRFLALAAAAPGPVALHSGSPDGQGHLAALVLSFLASRLGFDPQSAVAWVRIAAPALLAAPAPPPPPAPARPAAPPAPLARAASAEGALPPPWESGPAPPAAAAAPGIRRALSAPDAPAAREPPGREPALEPALPSSQGS